MHCAGGRLLIAQAPDCTVQYINRSQEAKAKDTIAGLKAEVAHLQVGVTALGAAACQRLPPVCLVLISKTVQKIPLLLMPQPRPSSTLTHSLGSGWRRRVRP